MVDVSKLVEPTPEACQKITSDLVKKYSGCYTSLNIQTITYDSGKTETDFWFNVGTISDRKDIFGKHLKSWIEVLDKYKELMEATSE